MISRHHFFKNLIAATLSAVMFATAAIATTLVRMDLTALARSADLIVRARCISSETRWESGSIWTFVDFGVIETFKGAPPQTLRVRLAGGRAGHLVMKVDGVPHFATGEEVVLFVERTSAGDFGVTSWAQGTFRIHRDAAGEPRLSQDTSHFAVFDNHTRQFAPTGIRNLSLNEFRQELSVALSVPLTTKQGSSR